MFHVDKCLKYT